MLRWLAAVFAAMIAMGFPGIPSAEARPDMVGYQGDYAPGTIVVKTNERRLYLTIDSDRALRYPVGVGKAGKQWTGTARIEGKYRDPAWAPPDDVKRDNPKIADVIAGGSPANPMGVAAMTLSGGGQYAIHGTTGRGRSAVSCHTAASACTITTLTISIGACRSARPWWYRNNRLPRVYMLDIGRLSEESLSRRLVERIDRLLSHTLIGHDGSSIHHID